MNVFKRLAEFHGAHDQDSHGNWADGGVSGVDHLEEAISGREGWSMDSGTAEYDTGVPGTAGASINVDDDSEGGPYYMTTAGSENDEGDTFDNVSDAIEWAEHTAQGNIERELMARELEEEE